MDPVESFRITKDEEKAAFSNTDRMTSALTLRDFIYNDPMIGIRDGKNNRFVLHHSPVPKSLKLYYNGKILSQEYYSFTGKIIVMRNNPMFGDELFADYLSIATKEEQ